jgi:hypothetical protein
MLSASVSNHHAVSYSYAGEAPQRLSTVEEHPDNKKKDNSSVNSESNTSTINAVAQISKEDQLIVQKLKQRDLEVKAHEQAHLSAAGNLASGGASFTYTQGPNGIRYATGGEVSIDTSRVEGDPAATIRKADAIRRAALAPMSPSSQDQLVAAKATALSSQAQADLSELIQEKQKASKTTETEQKTDSNKKTASEPTTDSFSEKGTIIDLSI